MRIPERYLPHRITVEAIDPLGGGSKWATPKINVHALVVDKETQVVDARPDSETRGQVIMSSTQIVLQPEEWIPPGSRVTVWAGKPQEKKMIVVTTGYFEHPIAPNSSQLWLV